MQRQNQTQSTRELRVLTTEYSTSDPIIGSNLIISKPLRNIEMCFHCHGFCVQLNITYLWGVSDLSDPPDSTIHPFRSQKGLTAIVYNHISGVTPNRSDTLRATWGHDHIPDRVHTSSTCAEHRLLHRVLLTNTRLTKIYLYRSDSCNRCKGSPAIFETISFPVFVNNVYPCVEN